MNSFKDLYEQGYVQQCDPSMIFLVQFYDDGLAWLRTLLGVVPNCLWIDNAFSRMLSAMDDADTDPMMHCNRVTLRALARGGWIK